MLIEQHCCLSFWNKFLQYNVDTVSLSKFIFISLIITQTQLSWAFKDESHLRVMRATSRKCDAMVNIARNSNLQWTAKSYEVCSLFFSFSLLIPFFIGSIRTRPGSRPRRRLSPRPARSGPTISARSRLRITSTRWSATAKLFVSSFTRRWVFVTY